MTMKPSQPEGNDTNSGAGVKTQEQRDFDETLQKLLVGGLALSVLLMLVGLLLALFEHQYIPTTLPVLNVVLSHVLALRPSGFLALGLLVLIATPVARVASSFVVFAHKRDWTFAGITLIVLCTVILSIVLGSS
jgi:uncharacterized membrane protein